MSKTMSGTVVAKPSDKTITVAINRVRTHRIYRKQYTVTKKYLVHDESNQAEVGDQVTIEETRPISKRKRWRLHTITRSGVTL